MNNIKVFGFGITIVISAVFIVSATKAHAYVSPDILVGQNMTVGSTGQDVVVLQALLSELGHLNIPAGIPLGYYGSLTKNAVASYQRSLAVAPAVGYFGPLTKVAMYSDFSGRGYLSMLGW